MFDRSVHFCKEHNIISSRQNEDIDANADLGFDTDSGKDEDKSGDNDTIQS